MMSRRILAVLALAAAAAVYPAAQGQPTSAQQPPSPQQPPQRPPVFRLGVDSVSVDVLVTDKQGRPVSDLTPEDFEVKEDGKLQSIETFKLVRAGEGAVGPTRASATQNILSIQQMASETARDENRLFAIFLDDYHTRRINALRVRKQLATFVKQLQPHDLVALVHPLLPMSAVTFSRDHDGTAMALMHFEGRKYDYTPMNPYEERLVYQPPQVIERERNQSVMSALEGLCLYMGGLREGRKNIIFVSEGFSGTMPPGVFTKGSMSPAANPMFGGTASGVDERMAQINTSDMQASLRYVFIAASRTNTAIYTLDPRGLAANEFSVEDRVDPSADRRVLNESIDTLYQLANETDGRPIVNRNDPMPALEQVLTDSSAYYLLGTSRRRPRATGSSTRSRSRSPARTPRSGRVRGTGRTRPKTSSGPRRHRRKGRRPTSTRRSTTWRASATRPAASRSSRGWGPCLETGRRPASRSCGRRAARAPARVSTR